MNLICSFFVILTTNLSALAQDRWEVREVPMTQEEANFVRDLNLYRARDGEAPLKYRAYQTPDGDRHLWTTTFFGDETSRTQTRAHLFFSKLHQLTNGAPVVTELFAGFSSAGYQTELLKSDLQAYTKASISENKRLYGPNTKTVFISGATAEGIGLVYSPEVAGPDLLKIGIVSDQALAYEMKYGNQIAPQDLIFLVKTFTDKSGSRTWEVKPTEGDTSYNNSAHDQIDSKKSKFNLFEGGEIGFKEALEWLENRASASFARRKFELNLFLGYEATKHKKDKGYRAASQLTQILLRFPELIPTNVTVNLYRAGEVEKGPVSFAEFRKTKAARRLLDKSSAAYRSYVQRKKAQVESIKQKNNQWYQKNQDQLEAEIRKHEAWLKTDGIASTVFAESQERNQRSLKFWQMVMDPNSVVHPDHKQDRESGVAKQSAQLISARISSLDWIIANLSSPDSLGNGTKLKCSAVLQ
ncbi:MAG: hypothetical protein ACK5Y2_04195 [Bdellovibrionales bacterium]